LAPSNPQPRFQGSTLNISETVQDRGRPIVAIYTCRIQRIADILRL